MRIIATLLLALALCTPAAANNGTGTVSFCERHGCAQGEGPATPCEPEECPTITVDPAPCSDACRESADICAETAEVCKAAFLACSEPTIFTRCKSLTPEQAERRRNKPGYVEYEGRGYKCPVKDHPQRVFVPVDLVQ